MTTFKFMHPIKNGEIEIENVDGQLRITIPGAPKHTTNTIYIDVVNGGFVVKSHNLEVSEYLADQE